MVASQTEAGAAESRANNNLGSACHPTEWRPGSGSFSFWLLRGFYGASSWNQAGLRLQWARDEEHLAEGRQVLILTRPLSGSVDTQL